MNVAMYRMVDGRAPMERADRMQSRLAVSRANDSEECQRMLVAGAG